VANLFYLAKHPHSFIIIEAIKQLQITLLILYVARGREEVVMPVNRLKEFLDTNNIKYISSFHSNAYTAQEVAASAHIPGRKIAKTVMVKIDDKMAMAVLSASDKVDFTLLKKAAGASKTELANENEFADLFPGCHIGAIPPFGNLYDMQVIVDEKLSDQNEIVFNAGSYTELITLHYEDFKSLVKPCVANISIED